MEMRNLTIVVASSHLIGVRETLRDWQAGGLATNFVWVPVEAQDMGRYVRAQLVSGGALFPVDVRGLSGQVQYSRACVVALGAIVGNDAQVADRIDRTWQVGSYVRQVVGQDFGSSTVVPLRAVFAPEDASTRLSLTDSGGWIDLVFSPSDSKGPGVGTRPLDSSSVTQLCTFLASQVAPVAGLWTDMPEGTVDDVQPAHTGYRGRLTRSFYRRLDGSAVEHALRERAFETESGYPLPNHQGAPTQYMENDPLAVHQSLNGFWNKNWWLVNPQREAYVPPKPTPISAGAALKKFGLFIGSALKGSPSAFAAGLADSTKAAVAETVHSLVFGKNASEYNVVVGGVDSNGRPVGWDESVGAARRIEQELGADRHDIDMSGLWKSMVTTSLTLLDYGTHDRDLPPQSPQPSIVRNPASVAPDPENRFVLKGSVAGRLGAISVQPADGVHVEEVQKQIRDVAQDTRQHTPDADAQLQEMTDWYEASRQSFVSQVGDRIVSEFNKRKTEIANLMENLGKPAGEEDSHHILAETQRILSVKMRQLCGYLAAITAVMFFLAGMSWAPWWLAWTTLGVALLGGVGGAFALFTRSQAKIFQVQHEARKFTSERETNARNLKVALSEYTRLGEAYPLYLRWADIIGAFVHRPFGTRTQSHQDHQRHFDDLPINMGHAEYVVNRQAVEETVRYLRSETFYTGWTAEQFRNFISVSLERSGVFDYQLGGGMHSIFAEQSTANDSVLTKLALSLRENGVDPILEGQYWQDMRQRLTMPHMEANRSVLLGQIQTSGSDVAQNLRDFQGTVGHEYSSATGLPETLDDELLTADAAGQNKHELAQDLIKRASSGFGDVCVHTQITHDLTPDDLIFAKQYDGEVNWGHSAWSVAEQSANIPEPQREPEPNSFGNPFGEQAF